MYQTTNTKPTQEAALELPGRWLCDCSRCGYIAPADYPWLIHNHRRYCDRFCRDYGKAERRP